mgnify:CR=1 FL=1
MTSLFYIEHANGKVSDQSLKAITAASQIEGDVHGLIVGSNIDEAVASGRKTASGIPLPFADPAVGAGLFPERVLKVHSERIDGMSAATKKEDTIRLLSKMQLLDVSDIAVRCTRRRLLLVLAKSDLIELDGGGD